MRLEPGLVIDKIKILKNTNKSAPGVRKWYWLCMCECGTKFEVSSKRLQRANIISCESCANKDEVIGQKFNYLTAVKRDVIKKHSFWIFKCKCGNECSHSLTKVAKGLIKSCGCYKKEGSNQVKHGSSRGKNRKTPLYNSWCRIKERCFNPNKDSYERYGGRGITLYYKWIDDFDVFRKYVIRLKNCPDTVDTIGGSRDNRTLDRINNDGDYTPGNVRWVKHITQCNNRSSNKKILYKGINYKSLAIFCRKHHLKYGNVNSLLHRGISIENVMEGGYSIYDK